MEITENRIITACENLAQNKETQDDREIIMGYIMYLEGELTKGVCDKIMEDCLVDEAFEGMREN